MTEDRESSPDSRLARDVVASLAARASKLSLAPGAGANEPKASSPRAAVAATRIAVLPGVAGPALATALAESRRAPVLVLAPTEDDARAWARDLRALAAPDASDDFVLLNPPLEITEEQKEGEEPRADMSGLSERLRVLRGLATGGARVVATSLAALLELVPSPGSLERTAVLIEKGGRVDPAELARKLADAGHARVPLVEAPGEFAVRGGIIDVFGVGADAPVRLELFDDEVESIRTFEPSSQRSTGELARVLLPIVPPAEFGRARRAERATLLDHLGPDGLVIVVDEPRVQARAASLELPEWPEGAVVEPEKIFAAVAARARIVVGEGEGAAVDLGLARVDDWGGSLEAISGGIARAVQRGERVTLACLRPAERDRIREVLTGAGLSPRDGEGLRVDAPGITLVVSELETGFRLPAEHVVLLSTTELFRRWRNLTASRARRRGFPTAAARAIESFADLEDGEPVVHASHGVGLFRGVTTLEKDGKSRDFLALEFDEGAVLYVPAERIGLIRRWIGPGGAPPRLSKLGGTAWKKRAREAERAARDLASELLEVQAERRLREGHPFPPDDTWQRELEASFPFPDTEDQTRSTFEIKRDLEQTRPMDRLLCGDVGYGKTEVAIRAAFKVATHGKQVAVLVPTTLLAQQHLKTFKERLAEYPVSVDMISRFRTRGEQKKAIDRAKAGKLDILIGTHRLLSADVGFKDLGLVIIDEEQRFGVEHKERLKQLRRTVHVLTLTATPIPRTLHMSLSGARDISVLTTPPEGRQAVETRLIPFERKVVRAAIERELARDGQVFVIHDRVATIDKFAQSIQQLVPRARVIVAHGQLHEDELEDRMLAFLEGRADILVSTTIVENGLDIPRANTLIVHRADRFGLAELHQLRGRVGRGRVRGQALFLLPEKGAITDIAERRLRAIEEFDELGAGFRIAMRDLEIRGAGNVLGAEQSGHIANVGYDMYCRLLRRAIDEMRGVVAPKAELDLERDLDLEAGEMEVLLDVAAFVPDAYVEDVALKIEAYRKLGAARSEDELRGLKDELRDRYGPSPKALDNLFDLRRLRLKLARLGVERVSRIERVLSLVGKDGAARDRVERALARRKDALRPIDERTLYLVLDQGDCDDEAALAFILDVLDRGPPKPGEQQGKRAAPPRASAGPRGPAGKKR